MHLVDRQLTVLKKTIDHTANSASARPGQLHRDDATTAGTDDRAESGHAQTCSHIADSLRHDDGDAGVDDEVLLTRSVDERRRPEQACDVFRKKHYSSLDTIVVGSGTDQAEGGHISAS